MNTQHLDPATQYLNIDDDSLDVYRVFSKRRFDQLLQSKSLVMVRPEMWSDPFENFFLKGDAVDEKGNRVSLREIYSEWYGQCWTLHRDTDAMWRIYSPDSEGVRVKTTIRKLFLSIFDQHSIWSPLMYFIGKVDYLTLDDLKAFRDNHTFDKLAFGGSNHSFAKTLLMKRQAFAHENEVRLLFSDVRCKCEDQNGFCGFPINPNELFDEVAVDPRLKSSDAQVRMDEIKKLGYSGSLIQSDLYRWDLGPINL